MTDYADGPPDPFMPIEEIGPNPALHEHIRELVRREEGRDIGPCPPPVLLLKENREHR